MQEKISKNLGVPFVVASDDNGQKIFVCENGVGITEKEYLEGIDVKEAYKEREKEIELYDYTLAKEKGIAQKKETSLIDSYIEPEYKGISKEQKNFLKNKEDKSTLFICLILAFTSLVSMYVSTLHTAEYLFAYADKFSSWLMSLSVTAYNTTAFEVSILFNKNKRKLMSFIFMFLWIIVTLFSMTTTVSVFYDRFNFNTIQATEENKEILSDNFVLDLLQKKEQDLRNSIDFKKKDIVYRQSMDYATTAVRNELSKLEQELQDNLTEQQKILFETPQAENKDNNIKKSLFAFISDFIGLEAGILEFIMSTLSAIFVNLICPLSLTAVVELLQKKDLTK